MADTERYDIVIAGAGLTGAAFALAAAQAQLKVVMIDPQPFSAQLAPTFDGRSTAVAFSTFRMLDALGLGESLRPHACRMDHILVTDGRRPGAASRSASPAFLRFDADEIGGRMWLFTITRNTLLNARRATRRRLAATDRLRHELEQFSTALAGDSADAIDVRGAVARLSREQRELVELVHWDGFSVADAAQIMGVSASTARSRYAAAKDRLRVILVGAPEESKHR